MPKDSCQPIRENIDAVERDVRETEEVIAEAKGPAWSVTLFALFMSATVAVAAPGGGVQTGPGTALPPKKCDKALESIIAEIMKPGNHSTVAANSTLLVGGVAYAEGAVGDDFVPTGGSAGPVVGTGIVGTGNLGALSTNEVNELTFVITKDVPGKKAKLQWEFRGKTYKGDVNNCSSSYWTATTPNLAIKSSTISIWLGPVQKVQTPE